MSPSNLPRTVGELRAAGHRERGVKQEIRENLLTALADGDNVWPGILGFDDTVIPQVERALIAGHDFVLLGERGQGKTRLLRALAGLLDEWTPVIAGAELGEHPYTPITPESIRRAAQLGDDLPVAWKHRSERYTEKLATPDTSVADLVGDVDPIKVAEGRSLGDPETIAYGLIPRAHRGIVAVNELPDLAERIQVSMLNVMEERDIQVRGYTLRLPLDVLVVASANPEDYTNRGRIITPIKDRFGAEIRTHYPLELEAEMGVIVQEAHLSAQVPDYLMQVLARFARYLRESRSIDQRSGVSARFAIAAAETVAAAARHRGAVLGETDPVARVVDLGTVIDVLRGKLEFESGEEGREQAVLEHLLRRATADTASRVLGGIDVGSLVTAVEGGSAVTTGERVSAKDVLAAVPGLPVVDRIARKLGAESEGERAAALELALEALYLAKRVDKVCGSGPPVDLRDALEQIGQDVMAGASPRRALSELLRRGTRNLTGADRLAAEVNRRRRELLRRNNLDGTLQEIKKLLDEAVLAERKELARALDDDARFAELQLDALPASPAKAVQELAEYRWRSGQAREKYEQIKDLLGRELLDQRFAGMKQALAGATDDDRRRVTEMLDDLNDLLDKHARGEDTQRDFDEFMTKHGEFFPENPRNVEELLDSLAKRAAAAQRFRNSLSQEQRDELDALAQQAFGSPALMRALDRLDAHLQAARPGEDWTGSQQFSGDNPFGMGEGTQALADIAELEQLAEQLSQSYPGASMDDVDLDALARQLGDQAAVDARTLAELERALVNQGFLDRGSDGQWRLSPKAMRRLGETALRDVAQQLSGRHGERDHRRAGAAGELTGATRPWQFGDTEPWHVARTLTNAVLRQAAAVHDRIRITVEDVEVAETETRTQAAVALLVDTSFSMVMENRWLPMKRTALALHHLVCTRFRSDALQIIAFGRYARTVTAAELTGLAGVYEQGTNLHHALALAGRHLRRHAGAQPVVLVVTDGEPTAHLEDFDGDGTSVFFDYPPHPRTIAHTVRGFDDMARLGAQVTIFRLGSDPGLARFIDQVARRVQGRVVVPDLDGLGAAVVGDYLRFRRR